jgi:hypothetical protein
VDHWHRILVFDICSRQSFGTLGHNESLDIVVLGWILSPNNVVVSEGCITWPSLFT